MNPRANNLRLMGFDLFERGLHLGQPQQRELEYQWKLDSQFSSGHRR